MRRKPRAKATSTDGASAVGSLTEAEAEAELARLAAAIAAADRAYHERDDPDITDAEYRCAQATQ